MLNVNIKPIYKVITKPTPNMTAAADLALLKLSKIKIKNSIESNISKTD